VDAITTTTPVIAARIFAVSSSLTQLRSAVDVLAVMRRIGVAVICLWALLLTTGATSDASTHHKASSMCPPHYEVLIDADAQAVVYEAPGRNEGFPEIFACAHGHKAYRLGVEAFFSHGGGGGVSDEALAGEMVAYESSLVSEGSDSLIVVVRDLRTGRVLHHLSTDAEGTVRIVVKSDGAVAWINGYGRVAGQNAYQLHAVDKLGNRLLATGTEIDPDSLALAGSTLYWTQGGQPMSATLALTWIAAEFRRAHRRDRPWHDPVCASDRRDLPAPVRDRRTRRGLRR
jgi:hypothetical protein